jgi:GDP-L-fucose synthase
MVEEALLTGLLEPTNEPYAIAKIAGIKLCESYNRQHKVDYRSVMPTNLYGPNDNFHPDNSHVIPAMMRRFHLAKIENQATVEVWGSGKPKREFLYVDDMAEACVSVMGAPQELYQSVAQQRVSHINIGTGLDCSIEELANLIKDVINYPGGIVFDVSKPDGAPRKLLNVNRAHALGWQAKTKLRDGLQLTYQWYLNNSNALRKA